MENESVAGELRPEADREAGRIAYLENLDELRQQAGITAAMLRDGRARAIVEQSEPQNILFCDLRMAWRHAVRAFNYCENEGMDDTVTAIGEVVVRLSQLMEFATVKGTDE